jgi:hypothetical protein
MADLSRMREVLKRLARDCRRGHRTHCPLLETLTAAPETDPRPRRTRRSVSR